MAQHKLSPGEHGDITFQRFDKDGKSIPADSKKRATRWTARAYFGGLNGERLRKAASGATKGEAEEKLEQAIERAHREALEQAHDLAVGREIPREWTAFAADHLEWIESADSGYAHNTVVTYADHARRFVVADSCPFSGRRMDSLTHLELFEWLLRIANTHGDGTAHATQSVVSGMFKRAAKGGVVSVSPMAGMGRVKRTRETARTKKEERARQAVEKGEELRERNTKKSLEAEDYDRLTGYLDHLRVRPVRPGTGKAGRPRKKDPLVADIVEFMLGTGCRIGEALALRWDDVDLTEARVRVTINGTMTGKGRQDWTKTEHGERPITVPANVADLLRRRLAEDEIAGGETKNRVGAVFPSTTGTWLDRSNAGGYIREVLDAEGVELRWATSHTMRRTVINDLLDGGLAAPRVAAHVGHSDASFTLRRYGDTETMPEDAGDVLAQVRAKRKVATKVAT